MALVLYTGPPTSLVSHDAPETEGALASATKSFVGLSNQGATCYLNSLLQTLYMTPDFRRAMFKWKYDPAKDGEEEFCIPLQLQKLFGYLQLSSTKAVDTVALTRSFGWEGSEVFQQQDVQELLRVMFDALEESFKGTEVGSLQDPLPVDRLPHAPCLVPYPAPPSPSPSPSPPNAALPGRAGGEHHRPALRR